MASDQMFDLLFADLRMKGVDGFALRERIWMPKEIPEHLVEDAKARIPQDDEQYEIMGFVVELYRHQTVYICMYHVMPYKLKDVNKAIESRNWEAIVPKETVDGFKDKIAVMLMDRGLQNIVQQNLIAQGK